MIRVSSILLIALVYANIIVIQGDIGTSKSTFHGVHSFPSSLQDDHIGVLPSASQHDEGDIHLPSTMEPNSYLFNVNPCPQSNA